MWLGDKSFDKYPCDLFLNILDSIIGLSAELGQYESDVEMGKQVWISDVVDDMIQDSISHLEVSLFDQNLEEFQTVISLVDIGFGI